MQIQTTVSVRCDDWVTCTDEDGLQSKEPLELKIELGTVDTWPLGEPQLAVIIAKVDQSLRDLAEKARFRMQDSDWTVISRPDSIIDVTNVSPIVRAVLQKANETSG